MAFEHIVCLEYFMAIWTLEDCGEGREKTVRKQKNPPHAKCHFEEKEIKCENPQAISLSELLSQRCCKKCRWNKQSMLNSLDTPQHRQHSEFHQHVSHQSHWEL